MKKIELLAPAGSQESLIGAINAGANAVYLAGKRFGARAFSNNFDDENLIEAIHYAHLRGVFVYVTINTLIFDDEVDELDDQVELEELQHQKQQQYEIYLLNIQLITQKKHIPQKIVLVILKLNCLKVLFVCINRLWFQYQKLNHSVQYLLN